MLIHTLNPRTLILGGPLSEVQDEILSGVRAAVYERALPHATRKLTITETVERRRRYRRECATVRPSQRDPG
jgi:hypothetical protein